MQDHNKLHQACLINKIVTLPDLRLKKWMCGLTAIIPVNFWCFLSHWSHILTNHSLQKH